MFQQKKKLRNILKGLFSKKTLKKYNFNDFFSYYQNLPCATQPELFQRLIFPMGFLAAKDTKKLAAAKGPTLFLLQQPGKPFSLIPDRSEWMLKKSAKRKLVFWRVKKGETSGRFQQICDSKSD